LVIELALYCAACNYANHFAEKEDLMINRIIFSLFLGILIFIYSCESGSKNNTNEQGASNTSGNRRSGKITFNAPSEWIKETPSSSMRKAQFKWPGQKGQDSAELAVFYFPGTGGSVEANLQRWYGQFKQPDGSPTTDHVSQKKEQVNGMKVTEVYVTGTYLKSTSPMMMQGPVEELAGYAMLAAIVEAPNGPWFFKATGPKATIDYWRQSFDQFTKTFKYE
jgi:hypothetical protein